MTRTSKAVYEGGSLRLAAPRPIADGTEVDVTVTTAEPTHVGTADARTAAQMLAEIAALPSEVVDDGFSGADHDAVLYGYDAHLPDKKTP